MKYFCLCLSILATVSIITGCGTTGIIYKHVTTPLDINMSRTPFSVVEKEGDIKELAIDVRFLWGSNAIGDIAKANGMETVYYADIEELQILGYWSQHTIHIYGK